MLEVRSWRLDITFHILISNLQSLDHSEFAQHLNRVG
jgi:hypothetical protein